MDWDTSRFSRRSFLKISGATIGAIGGASILGTLPGCASSNTSGGTSNTATATIGNAAGIAGGARSNSGEGAEVFFTRDISPEGLKKLYARINEGITGKVAIKLHSGEPHGPNLLPVAMIQSLQATIPNSTIVECNVLYGGPRGTTAGHLETLKTNGFDFCPVDIMDADGDANIPIEGGKQLKTVAVGKNFLNYDSMLVYTHFKGHTMGGFGGSLKNLAIGCASGKVGKAEIHHTATQNWQGGEPFLERMVEAGHGMADHYKGHITYINVLKNLSVDCDCDAHGAAPTMADIGILASRDILAVDQASVDMVYAAAQQTNNKDLTERIESRKGLRQLTYMKELGMGNNTYHIVEV